MKSFRTIPVFILVVLGILISPKLLAQKSKSNPSEVFECFWKIMDQNYAFFELKKINWEEVYNINKEKINNNTSDGELFEILVKILTPFNDAHIKLATTGPDKLVFSGSRASLFNTEFSSDSLKVAYFKNVENTLSNFGFDTLTQVGPILSEKKPIYNHSPFEYTKSEQFGYLKISWFFYNWSKISRLSLSKDRKQYLNTFHNILDKLAYLDGIIIDLRNNIGGVSGYPEKLAGRFTTNEFIGEYTCKRKKGGRESFTKLKSTKVKPGKEEPFLKPVVILVNDETVSAAEEFIIMMKTIPNVKIIGMPTQGALSDVLSKKLPNGRTISLSNMRFYTPDMICYENIGIPVDVEVQNTLEDLKIEVDPVLRKAIETLQESISGDN